MTLNAVSGIYETTSDFCGVWMLFHSHDASSDNTRDWHTDDIHLFNGKTERIECQRNGVRIVW
jgi:hypothetical protein